MLAGAFLSLCSMKFIYMCKDRNTEHDLTETCEITMTPYIHVPFLIVSVVLEVFKTVTSEGKTYFDD